MHLLRWSQLFDLAKGQYRHLVERLYSLRYRSQASWCLASWHSRCRSLHHAEFVQGFGHRKNSSCSFEINAAKTISIRALFLLRRPSLHDVYSLLRSAKPILHISACRLYCILGQQLADDCTHGNDTTVAIVGSCVLWW